MEDYIKYKLQVVTTLRVDLEFDSHRELKEFYTRDISTGGIFIISDNPMEVGTDVELSIHPPGDLEPFTIRGIVIHTVSPDRARPGLVAAGMGIHFVDLTDELFAKLDIILNGMEKVQDPIQEEAPRPSMVPEQSSERREHMRFLSPLRVNIRIPGPRQFNHFLKNSISNRELFIRTQTPTFIDQPVYIQVISPKADRVFDLNAGSHCFSAFIISSTIFLICGRVSSALANGSIATAE